MKTKLKTKIEEPKESAGPTVLQVASISEEKMQAISQLCAAVKSLAETLNSTNVAVTVSHCHFIGSGQHPALVIK